MRQRLIVSGHVQGVWYRDWFVGEAQALGLSGWVRNRRDGTVEAMVDGAEPAVAAMIEKAWAGSPASRVDHVDAMASDAATALAGFTRRPTA